MSGAPGGGSSSQGLSCLFRCGAFVQSDPVGHDATCRVCVGFLRDHLHYNEPIDRGHLVALGANSGSCRDEDVAKLAVWAHVLYKRFNHLRRRSGAPLGDDELYSFISSTMWACVAGSPNVSAFIANCWDSSIF